MKENMIKFLKILVVEMEDMEEDIKTMEDLYDYRYKKKEITEYVHLENMAMLKSEFIGILKLSDFIVDLEKDISRFKDIDDLIDYIKVSFKARVKEAGYPEAVYLFMNRKIEKVRTYLK